MHKKLIHIVAFLLCTLAIHSQELRCTVSINRDQVPSANQQTFQTLEQAITELMNTTKWTNLTFAEHERIDCQLMIVCKSVSETGLYTCEATIQASRPVYNTTYTSPLLNLKDKNFSFTWNMEPLNVQMTTFEANLPAMLAYYAYLFIGMDLDTFSPLGGTEVLRMAENVVDNAQSLNVTGWKAFGDDRNRHAILNDYLESSLEPLRQMQYKYHRLGLDEMAQNADRGRVAISEALELLKEAHSNKPLSTWPQIFTDFKRDEIVNIYSGHGTDKERQTVYDIVSNINASQNTYWSKIKK